MGIPFQVSLQNLFERVSNPLIEFFHHDGRQWTDDHELKWQCYASGQMTGADLEHEIVADPGFADYVKSREQHLH
ncbi:hypothetical protein [Aestuariivirga sp.]|uniref:hypothetical protein n=1 Tax=Aestuariivirga sp. TaxID=2650926 RepID=UPI0035937AED